MLQRCKALSLWKTDDCFFYKATKFRKVEQKLAGLQIPGSSCSSDTTWCCNLLERRRRLSSTHWLQWLNAVIYSEIQILHPSNQEFRPEFSCCDSDQLGFRKISPSLYHQICSVAYSSLWVKASSKELAIGVQCILKTGKTIWWQNKNCSWTFRSICATRMNVCICESMGHRTMKILEGQKHTECVSVVLLKKVEFLILLKDLCRIYCHGDW